MKQMYEWLFFIEGKCPMFIGSNSLHDMHLMIIGYSTALERQGIKDNFYPGFQDYVQKYYNIPETAMGWARIISKNHSSQEEAMDAFYTLLHRYYDMLYLND